MVLTSARLRCWFGALIALALLALAPTAGALPREEEYEPAPPPPNTCQAATPACGYYGNLTPPTLSATVTGPADVKLSWTPVRWVSDSGTGSTGVTGYTVERRLPGGAFVAVAYLGNSTTTWTDTRLKHQTTYEYRVVSTGSPKTSNVVAATTGSAQYAAPTLSAQPRSPREIALSWSHLTWQPTSSSPLGLTGYLVQRRAAGGAFTDVALLDASTTSHVVGGLTHSTGYEFRVIALGPVVSSNTVSTSTMGPQLARLSFVRDSNRWWWFNSGSALLSAEQSAPTPPANARLMTIRNVSTDLRGRPLKLEPLRYIGLGSIDQVLSYDQTIGFDGRSVAAQWEARVVGQGNGLTVPDIYGDNCPKEAASPSGCTRSATVALIVTWV